MPRKPHDDGQAAAGPDERPVIHRPVSSPVTGGHTKGATDPGPNQAKAIEAPTAGQPAEAGAADRAEPRLVSSAARPAVDADEDAALRPRRFDEFVGQRKIVDNLAVYVQAARRRGDALDHVLLS